MRIILLTTAVVFGGIAELAFRGAYNNDLHFQSVIQNKYEIPSGRKANTNTEISAVDANYQLINPQDVNTTAVQVDGMLASTTPIKPSPPAEISTLSPIKDSTISDTTDDYQARVETLPSRMFVQKQWSIIRATPTSVGEIIASLAKGTTVEIITKQDDWYHIVAGSDAAPSGYMHKSTINLNRFADDAVIEDANNIEKLPSRMIVRKQWSAVRATPNPSGDLITSLAKGTVVEITTRNDEWYNISAINKEASIGYMHKSTITRIR